MLILQFKREKLFDILKTEKKKCLRDRSGPHLTISIAQKSAGRWNHIPTYRVQCDIRDLALRTRHMCARIVSGTRVPGAGWTRVHRGYWRESEAEGPGREQVRARCVPRGVYVLSRGAPGPCPTRRPAAAASARANRWICTPLPASGETFFSLPSSLPSSPRSQETPGEEKWRGPPPPPPPFLPFRRPSPPLL